MKRVIAGVVLAAVLPGGVVRGQDLLLSDVRVVDVERGELQKGRRDVLIRGGKIAAVEPHDPGREAEEVVKGRGRFLIPGLIDSHVHLMHFGADVGPIFLRHGVTSIREMGGDLPVLRPILEQLEVAPEPKLGVYSAVGIVESRQWIERSAELSEEIGKPEVAAMLRRRFAVFDGDSAQVAIERLEECGAQFVKIRSFASESSFQTLAELAAAQNWKIAGHAPMNHPVPEIVRLGLSCVEHCFLNFGFLDDAGIEADYPPVEAAMLDTGAVLCPTLIANHHYEIELEELRERVKVLRPDPATGMTERAVEAWRSMAAMAEQGGPDWHVVLPRALGVSARLHRAGVPILVGTDTGAPLVYPGESLHTELENLVTRLGLTPAEALRGATLLAARWLEIEDRVGQIKPGLDADLVLLTANPLDDITASRSIRLVLRQGHIAHRFP